MKIDSFFAKPSKFKNRDIIGIRNANIIGIENNDDYIHYTFNVRNPKSGNFHMTEIRVWKSNRKVQFHCDCESFRYQFAAILHTRGCLLYPENFYVSKLPRKNAVCYVCKHLEPCLALIKPKLMRELK